MAKKAPRSKSTALKAPTTASANTRAAGRTSVEGMTLDTIVRQMSKVANDAGGNISIEVRFEPASRPAMARGLAANLRAAAAPEAAGIRLVRFEVKATSGVALLGVQLDMLTIPLIKDDDEWKGARTIAVEEDFVVVFIKAESPAGQARLDLTVTAGDAKLTISEPVIGKFKVSKTLDLA